MLRRDYIMKMFLELMTALEKLIHDRSASLTERQKDLEAMYTMFNNTADFFRQADEETVMLALTEFADDYVERVEMLAAVYRADALLTSDGENAVLDLRRKSLALYEYAESHSPDYSLLRQQRIAELREALSV